MLYVGSHLVDQILWYMGDDPVEVVADIRYRADTRADETTTFQIQFSRGAVAPGMVTQTSLRRFDQQPGHLWPPGAYRSAWPRLHLRRGRGEQRAAGLQPADEHSTGPDGRPPHPDAPAAVGRVCTGDPRWQPAITVSDGRRVL